MALLMLQTFFPLSVEWQLGILFVLVFSLGIPHGGLDLLLDRSMNRSGSNRQTMQFLLRYVCYAAVYALVWIWEPVAAFLIFLFITSVHFGEMDWMMGPAKRTGKFLSLLYGMAWIVMLLASHMNEAAPICELMTGHTFSAARFLAFSSFIFPYTVVLLAVITLGCYFVVRRSSHLGNVANLFLIQTVFLVFLNFRLPLWLFFGFYFGIWHSVLSLDLIRKELEIADNFKGWKVLLWKALPFSVLAWVSIVVVVLLSGTAIKSTTIIQLVFSVIAVLTLPHLQVFSKLTTRSQL